VTDSFHLAATFLAAAPPDGGSDVHGMVITVATAITVGVMLMVVARRTRLPAIVLLLAGGVLIGPAVWGDHALVRPELLGDGLRVLVGLAVGLILFEGGLTLDLAGYRAAPVMIKRLLTVGVVVTWLVTALAIRLITGLEAQYAFLAASLVIVTGPTVIAPLLKRIRIVPRLHNILHWEGVLIDPIGVFIALLCFEYVVAGESGGAVIANLGERVAAGLAAGAVGGGLLTLGVRRRIVPEDMVNVFALGCAVLAFVLAEGVESEAGLLAVTVAGFIFGLGGSARVQQVREFKAELTDLLIGTLFILLCARLTFDQFQAFGAGGFAVVLIVMLVVRPLSILLCSIGRELSGREKAFLAWVAPRGIVAASMASLFALSMGASAEARFVETFTYSVIIATIVIQGLTAGPLARALGLRRPEPTGWLIIGAHTLGRRVAKFIASRAEVDVVVVDSNARAVREARAEGITAMNANALDATIRDRTELQSVGNLLALTDNEDLNIRLCQAWRKDLGSTRVFRCNPTAGAPEPSDEEDGQGRVIWPRLPRPSLIAGEVARGETAVFEGAWGPSPLATPAVPIVAVVDGRVAFDPAEAKDDDPEARALFLRRSAEYLRAGLRPELVMTAEASDPPALFESMLDAVVRVCPGLPRAELLSELIERETAFPTALGHGIAVPHAFSMELDARIIAVARIPDGVDYGAADGRPVHLAMLLLSPAGDPDGHVATLAEIARKVVHPDRRSRLLEAEAPEEIIAILLERDRG
jgi:NhaP-type Na+/H+ or K+/H+ antiporter/mannitol/fructose-specific phosphotransferase system IIA component (Ntr-type)